MWVYVRELAGLPHTAVCVAHCRTPRETWTSESVGGQQIIYEKGPENEYFRLCEPQGLGHNYSSPSLQQKAAKTHTHAAVAGFEQNSPVDQNWIPQSVRTVRCSSSELLFTIRKCENGFSSS